MKSKAAFFLVLLSFSQSANAGGGVLLCHARKSEDADDIKTLRIDLDRMTLTTSRNADDIGGITFHIQKVGVREGKDVYRAGPHDEDNEGVTLYIPQNSYDLDLHVEMDWKSNGDGAMNTVRYLITCARQQKSDDGIQ